MSRRVIDDPSPDGIAPGRPSAPAARPLLSVRGLEKTFGPVTALAGVDLDIGAGVTGLLGPNGSGKTTLVKILLGLLRPTRGSGEILGERLGRGARSIRSRVGFLPEDDAYIDGLSGVEMVAFAARLAGLPRREALRRSHEILDFCGVEEERYRRVDTYSTGMRRQLGFAQAIVHDPPFLILDEPTASLDPEERRAMLRRIRILARRHGKGVLISTHLLPDVREISDQVVILVRGRIRLVESMAVLARPSAPGVALRVLGEPRAAAASLRERGFDARLTDERSIEVLSAAGDLVARLWDWSREEGITMRSLAPATNSLERIFLETARRETDADP